MKTYEDLLEQVPDDEWDAAGDSVLKSRRYQVELALAFGASCAVPILAYFLCKHAFPDLLSSAPRRVTALVFFLALTLAVSKVFVSYVSHRVFKSALVRELRRRGFA